MPKDEKLNGCQKWAIVWETNVLQLIHDDWYPWATKHFDGSENELLISATLDTLKEGKQTQNKH